MVYRVVRQQHRGMIYCSAVTERVPNTYSIQPTLRHCTHWAGMVLWFTEGDDIGHAIVPLARPSRRSRPPAAA